MTSVIYRLTKLGHDFPLEDIYKTIMSHYNFTMRKNGEVWSKTGRRLKGPIDFTTTINETKVKMRYRVRTMYGDKIQYMESKKIILVKEGTDTKSDSCSVRSDYRPILKNQDPRSGQGVVVGL